MFCFFFFNCWQAGGLVMSVLTSLEGMYSEAIFLLGSQPAPKSGYRDLLSIMKASLMLVPLDLIT